jgi:N-acetyl-anhydromuramyl-L-alanine amidase AmpD
MHKTSNEGVGNLTVEVYDGNSVVKVHNAIVKITGHYKPPGNFKKPVSLSANTKLHGFVKFTDIPLDIYKVEVSKEGYKSAIIERASAKVPGKDPVGNFVKPNNLAKLRIYKWIKDGIIQDKNVELKIYPSVQHGQMNKVAAIVLHRTDSSNANSTLQAYSKGKKSGAHFLIDKSGKIYQTAKMNQKCWHVGILQSRCQTEGDCSQQENKRVNSLIHQKGLSFGRRARNLSRHEAKKKYPDRYPSNDDSIGIEVVGKFITTAKTFGEPTSHQFNSLRWLVELITTEYNLNINNDVYSHGAIARKQPCEGAQLSQSLSSGGS